MEVKLIMITIQSKRLKIEISIIDAIESFQIDIYPNSPEDYEGDWEGINIKLEDLETDFDLKSTIEESIEKFYTEKYLLGMDVDAIESYFKNYDSNFDTTLIVPKGSCIASFSVFIFDPSLWVNTEKVLIDSDLNSNGKISADTLILCEALPLIRRQALKWNDLWLKNGRRGYTIRID